MKIASLMLIAAGLVLMMQLSSCQVIPLSQQKTDNSPLSQRCPVNMVLYPADKKASDWVCDCRPGFVYFLKNSTCHKLFTRGPCPKTHYVYIGPEDAHPTCMRNPCLKNGHVSYKGQCHELGAKGGPCLKNQIFNVNEVSLQLECVQIASQPFHIITAPQRGCPKGSRRNSLGICKKVL